MSATMGGVIRPGKYYNINSLHIYIIEQNVLIINPNTAFKSNSSSKTDVWGWS